MAVMTLPRRTASGATADRRPPAGDALAAGLARTAPSGETAARLAELAPAELSDGGRVDALIALHRHQGWLQAMELRLLADLEARPLQCIPGRPDALVDFDETREQVAAALHLRPDTAGARLWDARRLVGRFPVTVRELARGRIHFMQAKALVETTEAVAEQPELLQAIEESVLPRMPQQTVSATRKSIERAIHRLDPDGAERRHEQAKETRGTFVSPEPEGMATFGARLTAGEAAQVAAGLDAVAKAAPEEDVRTMGQRRADALVALVAGRTAGQGAGVVARSATGSLSLGRGRVGTVVQVTIPYDTLIGVSNAPGELRGHGPITAGQARALAFGPDSVWYRLLLEPATGRLVKTDPAAYRPTAELERHVIARDPHCRFPGCSRPADRSDLHHVRAFARGGRTDEDNLVPLCRRHHLTAHRAGWSLDYDPAGGGLTWTAPTGHSYASHPHRYPTGAPAAA
jgi:hypothetical protein